MSSSLMPRLSLARSVSDNTGGGFTEDTDDHTWPLLTRINSPKQRGCLVLRRLARRDRCAGDYRIRRVKDDILPLGNAAENFCLDAIVVPDVHLL